MEIKSASTARGVDTAAVRNTTTSNATTTEPTVVTRTHYEVAGCGVDGAGGLATPYHAYYAGGLNDIAITLNIHKENFTDDDKRSGVRVLFSDPSTIALNPITDSDVAASPYLASTGAYTLFSLQKLTQKDFVENSTSYERYITQPGQTVSNTWEAAISAVEAVEDDTSEDSIVHISFSYAKLSQEVVEEKYTDYIGNVIGYV